MVSPPQSCPTAVTEMRLWTADLVNLDSWQFLLLIPRSFHHILPALNRRLSRVNKSRQKNKFISSLSSLVIMTPLLPSQANQSLLTALRKRSLTQWQSPHLVFPTLMPNQEALWSRSLCYREGLARLMYQQPSRH